MEHRIKTDSVFRVGREICFELGDQEIRIGEGEIGHRARQLHGNLRQFAVHHSAGPVGRYGRLRRDRQLLVIVHRFEIEEEANCESRRDGDHDAERIDYAVPAKAGCRKTSCGGADRIVDMLRRFGLRQVAGEETVEIIGKCFALVTNAKMRRDVVIDFANGYLLLNKFTNVYKGESDILVIEADESDGSIVNYKPHLGLCLNLQKDHKEIDVLQGYFKQFISHCKTAIINAEEENLRSIAPQAKTFGLSLGDIHPGEIKVDGFGSDFTIQGQPFRLQIPGVHNVANATAAVAAALEMGVDLETCAKALSRFTGIARRFASVGSFNKIEVVDDFAHNPHKLAATIAAAHLRGKRVLAFYQPHAFTSIKLLSNEFIESFSKSIGKDDHLWLTEVYYPGGTIPQGVSCRTIYEGLKGRGVNVSYNECREKLLAQMAAAAQPGDIVLILGARDPTLTDFARKLLNALKETQSSNMCKTCMLGNCCMAYKK